MRNIGWSLVIVLALGGVVQAAEPAGRHPSQADAEAIAETYRLVQSLYQQTWRVGAARCSEHAGDIAEALKVNPGSFAVWSLAVDCAEASGDVGLAADRRHSLQALMQDAVKRLPPDNVAFEKSSIPVVSPLDAYAFAHASGERVVLAHFDISPGFRVLPLSMVLYDSELRRERTLWFDVLGSALALEANPDVRFPDVRDEVARKLLRATALPGTPASWAIEYLDAVDSAEGDRLDAIESLAKQGNFTATIAFADTCFGRDPQVDCRRRAVAILQPWAQQGNDYAKLKLAGAFVDGAGIRRDPAMARRLIREVDEQRKDRSGTLQFDTMRTDVNEDRIDPLVRSDVLQLAQTGDPLAEALVANEFRFKDHEENYAFSGMIKDYVEHAATSGLPTAQMWLGLSLLKAGRHEQGLGWLEKAAAAGDVRAQLELGDIYSIGKFGQARDFARAVHWWELAALDLTNTVAAEQLGHEYWWTERPSVENRQLAERWLRVAAIRGDEPATEWLAHLYEEGWSGIGGGHEEVMRLYRWLADRQPHAADIRVYLASLLKAADDGVDHGEEIQTLLEGAINQGDGRSQYWLGRALLYGSYGPSEPAEAAVWLQRSIDNGEDRARSIYARMLLEGIGVEKDVGGAFAQWRTAIRKGQTGAINEMAWSECTSPDPEVFNPVEGLDLAGKLPRDANTYLDTLAACQAANADYEKAVVEQSEAIRLLRQKNPVDMAEVLEQYEARLAAYRSATRFVLSVPTLQAGIRRAEEARRRRSEQRMPGLGAEAGASLPK